MRMFIRVRHPDPKHERHIGSGVSFATCDGKLGRVKISDRLLTSRNLLSNQSLIIKAVLLIRKGEFRIDGRPCRRARYSATATPDFEGASHTETNAEILIVRHPAPPTYDPLIYLRPLPLTQPT